MNIYISNFSLAFDRSSNRVKIFVFDFDFDEDPKLRYSVTKGSDFMPEKFFIHYGFVKMVSPRCQRYKIFFSVAEGEAE